MKSLKETTLNTFFELSTKLGLTHLWDYKSQGGSIRWYNGSEIILKDLFHYPSDPNFDDLGSLEISGAFIDEVNQITVKARNIVKSRIRYRLDENNLIPKLLMTCNPSKNWVYTDFFKPHRDNSLPKHRMFIQSLLDDNPYISKHYKENLIAIDEVSKQRLLFGNWEYDNDPAKLINFEAITDLWTNTQVEGGYKYITADIARLGKDKTVLMLWDGLKVEKVFTINKSTLDVVGDKIIELKNTFGVCSTKILVDEDGVGGGVVDFLNVRGFLNNSRALNKENFQNLKTQCYYKLAKYINHNKIYIKDKSVKETIIAELEQVKSYRADTDARLQILPKEKVKEALGRSPDYSDTLMMRMFFELQPHKGNYYIY